MRKSHIKLLNKISKQNSYEEMKVGRSERNITDGSGKEPNYVLLKDEDFSFGRKISGEIGEPYILLSRDFSNNEIALVYHYKNKTHGNH